MKSLILTYEQQIAGYIEQYFNRTQKVKLWADVFSDESVSRKSQIFLGHQRTERLRYTRDPNSYKQLYFKRYFFEIRVEIFTLKNHQSALDLIEQILDDVLCDYQPFNEFSPFVPQESGEVQRDKVSQSWIYTGRGYSDLLSNVQTLSKTIDEALLEPRIVKVLFENAASDQNGLIGQFEKSKVTVGN